MKYLLVGIFLGWTGLAFAAGNLKAPEGAVIDLNSPSEGAVLSGKVHVQFSPVKVPGGGRYLISIDKSELPLLSERISKSDQYIDVPPGLTEIELQIAPGSHILQVLYVDSSGMQYDPPIVSASRIIEVR